LLGEVELDSLTPEVVLRNVQWKPSQHPSTSSPSSRVARGHRYHLGAIAWRMLIQLPSWRRKIQQKCLESRLELDLHRP
jgi:hypothetical protein